MGPDSRRTQASQSARTPARGSAAIRIKVRCAEQN